MQFKNWFNWNRYNSITPSREHKNRLYLERQNRDKRIVSALGTVFRSSKWSSYKRVNVSWLTLESTLSALKYSIAALLISTLVYSTFQYLDLWKVTGKLVIHLWWLQLTTLHYITALSTYWLFVLRKQLESSLVTVVKGYIVGNPAPESVTGSPNSPLKASTQLEAELSPRTLPTTPINIKSTNPHESILYYLVSTGNEDLLKILLSRTDTQTTPFTNLVRTLFQATYSITRPKLDYLTRHNSKTEAFFLQVKLNGSPRLTKLIYSYAIRQTSRPRSYQYVSSNPTRFNTTWAYTTAQLESSLYNQITIRKGVFSVDSRTLSDIDKLSVLDTNLDSLTRNLSTQLDWTKTSLWLYRYNLLHRNSLKFSHKNTLTKRLLGSGFYDTSLGSKNIHMASLAADPIAREEMFRDTYYRSYRAFSKNVFYNLGQEASHTPSDLFFLNKTSNLSNYEESLAWFLKRYYTFYTLPSNYRESILTASRPSQFVASNTVDTGTNKIRLARFLLKSDYRTIAQYSRTINGDTLLAGHHLPSTESPLSIKLDKFRLFNFKTTDFLLSFGIFNANRDHQYHYYSPLRTNPLVCSTFKISRKL